jgi:hypothetical protein
MRRKYNPHAAAITQPGAVTKFTGAPNICKAFLNSNSAYLFQHQKMLKNTW